MKLILLPILAFICFQVEGKLTETSDSTSVFGKNLFLGTDSITAHKPCAHCHIARKVNKDFRWQPTAFDIAQKFSDTTFEAWDEAINFPMSDRMFEDHEGYQFSETDYLAIQNYLKDVKETGLIDKSTRRLGQYLFVVLLLAPVFLLIERKTVKWIKIEWVWRMLFLTTIGAILYVLINQASMLGKQVAYEPDQPIKFSHAIHSTQNKIACVYCHTSATKGAKAGYPATNICMNCHAIIQEGSFSGTYEIRKLFEAKEQNKPVQWNRISALPSHVRFRHDIHTDLGNISCISCHGEVNNMHRVKQVNEFSMDWCLDCHQTMKVERTSFNPEVSTSLENLNNPHVLKDMGGWDCNRCHH